MITESNYELLTEFADIIIAKIKKKIISLESKEYTYSSGFENDIYYHVISMIEDSLKDCAAALDHK